MNEKVAFSTLVDEIADASGASKQFVREVARETTQLIFEGLVRDGVVRLHGFGVFKLRHLPARMGVNPRTGEPLEIPERNKVVFRPEKSLRTFINRKYNHLLPTFVEDLPTELLEKHEVTVVPPQAPLETDDPGVVFVNTEALEDTTELLAKGENGSPGFHDAPEPPPKLPDAFRQEPQRREQNSKRFPFVWAGFAAVLLLLLLFLFWPKNQTSENTGFAGQTPNGRTIQEQSNTEGVNSKTAGASDSEMTPRTDPGLAQDDARNAAKISGGNDDARNTAKISDGNDDARNAAKISDGNDDAIKTPGDEGGFSARHEHKVKAGDTLWELAGRYYKDSLWWPNIYRANTEQLDDPDLIRPNMSLKVPRLTSNTQKPARDDKRNIAQGHLEAYFAYKRAGKLKARLHLIAANNFDPSVVEEARARIAAEDIGMLEK